MNMSKLDRKVLRVYRAAMGYYHYWNRTFAVKPAARNGQFPVEIVLYNACAAAKKGKRK